MIMTIDPSTSRSVLRTAVTLLATVAWFGCTDEAAQLVTEPQELRVAVQERDFTQAMAAREGHTARLLALPGVVGTGVGIGADGEPTVTVFVLSASVGGVPERLDGVPVAVEVTGMFVAGGTTDRERPAANGYSVGHPDITAGTLGAVVKDVAGRCYILSNNHVLANSNNANIGDSALQPGTYDGGQDPQDAIASLAAFEPINFDGSSNTIDAAIAELVSPVSNFVTAQTPAAPVGYGAPGTVEVPAWPGQSVQKFGRTTGLTSAAVTEVEVSANICYECAGPFCMRCKKAARFDHLIATEDMSGGGDSGSLIVTNDGTKNPVGLLFAGSSTRTLANQIDLVLNALGVEVVNDLSVCGGGVILPNNSPTADFSWTASGLTVIFTDTSTDSDGDVVKWSWNFGDGGTSTAENPTHPYAASGTYTVFLTVTDNDDDTDITSQSVAVNDSGTGGFTLTATGYKVKGLKKADLEWSGAASSNVDVDRDGVMITTENDGFYTDNIDQRGGGSYTYKLCEAGSSTCSNEATVNF